jgi:hypothetical protein
MANPNLAEFWSGVTAIQEIVREDIYYSYFSIASNHFENHCIDLRVRNNISNWADNFTITYWNDIIKDDLRDPRTIANQDVEFYLIASGLIDGGEVYDMTWEANWDIIEGYISDVDLMMGFMKDSWNNKIQNDLSPFNPQERWRG